MFLYVIIRKVLFVQYLRSPSISFWWDLVGLRPKKNYETKVSTHIAIFVLINYVHRDKRVETGTTASQKLMSQHLVQ